MSMIDIFYEIKKTKLDEILIYLLHLDDKISDSKKNFGKDDESWLNDFNINELLDNDLVSEHENFLPNGQNRRYKCCNIPLDKWQMEKAFYQMREDLEENRNVL